MWANDSSLWICKSMPSCSTKKSVACWTSTHHCGAAVVVVVSTTYDNFLTMPSTPSNFDVVSNVSTVVLALKPIDEATVLPA